MRPLDAEQRDELRIVVKSARQEAESGVRAALELLAVDRYAPYNAMNETELELRLSLRARVRHVASPGAAADIRLLVEEAAYEHWHRMLFARFLAENGLLMFPDSDGAVPISLAECADLAATENRDSEPGGWELASRCAALMLPQIFRPDSPIFKLILPPERQREMERLAERLPSCVFTASDALDRAHSFWFDAGGQDESSVPAEPYMFDFLLDNSLGASLVYKATGLDGGKPKPGASEKLMTAETEDELRNFFALPGVPLRYLRFVKQNDEACESNDPQPVRADIFAGCDGGARKNPALRKFRWRPASGWFESWPDNFRELKVLDPCCGAGGFLVALLNALVPIRMELENLSARDAVDAVLNDNIRGLERDERSVAIAVFALALAAWKYPGAGYRKLPEINLACSGLSVGAAKEDWEKLAGGRHNLRIALGWMYDSFRDAPLLGSLIDPAGSDNAGAIVRWEGGSDYELSSAIGAALCAEPSDEERETTVAARGLARATSLLSSRYDMVAANVPRLPRARQDERLRRFCAQNYPMSKGDLATVFLERSLNLCSNRGTTCLILPDNWLAAESGGAVKFRENMLNRAKCLLMASIEPEGSLLLELSATDSTDDIYCLDSGGADAADIAGRLRSNPIIKARREAFAGEKTTPKKSRQPRTLSKPRASIDDTDGRGDPARFIRKFWELGAPGIERDRWRYLGGSDVELLDEENEESGENYPWAPAREDFDDPTNIAFHGHPCGCATSEWGGLRLDGGVLQTAVARLVGFRWPAEIDPRIQLSNEARELSERASRLCDASGSGIICIPPVMGEPSCANRLLDLLAASYEETWSNDVLAALLRGVGCAGKNFDFWLREQFFAQHNKLFCNRPFVWQIWDGLRDGFSALFDCRNFDGKALERLTFYYLGNWIKRGRQEAMFKVPGALRRLAAAERLKERLKLILVGKTPCDIFVRWKPMEEQPIGWAPDPRDGVRVNIRPFMSVQDIGKKGAGVLRDKPSIKWDADKGSDDESSPWYALGPDYGAAHGDRINCHHLKLEEKKTRKEARQQNV
jgi:hypothetical protein